MVCDDNPDPNTFVPQTVTVELTSGKRLVKRLEQVLASPDRRLDKQAQDSKFKRCWSLAAFALAAPEPLIDQLEQLETLDDVRPLFNQLTATIV
jgi:hypothetical protein